MKIDDKKIESLKFILNGIREICLKRSYTKNVEKCGLLLLEIEETENLTDEKYSELKNEIINLIDELKFIIQTETRFILFPLPDIKREAYEIGKKYMENFLEWINPEDNYTPEKLIGILEKESFRLDEFKEIIAK
jgi:hypothetical protein